MPLPKKHNEPFTTIYLRIVNDEDVPDIAKELVGAIRFVEGKVSRLEYFRLLELVHSFGGPMYVPLYPTMVKHVIAGYERVLTFDVSDLYRFSLNKDLVLLRLFYQGLEQYMPCEEVSNNDCALINPLKGKFKDYKAAACFVQNWVMDKDENKVRLVCTEFIEFCLFQFQLLGGWLTEGSADAVRKMKGDTTFWDRLYRKVDTTLTKALLNDFLCEYSDVSAGFRGDAKDSGVVAKCRELIDCFIEPDVAESNIDEDSFIYGNRLSLDEKLLLPMCSNMLMPHELAGLLQAIKQSDFNSVDLAFLLTSLITSKPLGYLESLPITVVPLNFEMGDYIDVCRGVWVRRAVHTPAAFEPTARQQEFLNLHQNHVELPLPIFLIKTLNKMMKRKKLVVTNFMKLGSDMGLWGGGG